MSIAKGAIAIFARLRIPRDSLLTEDPLKNAAIIVLGVEVAASIALGLSILYSSSAPVVWALLSLQLLCAALSSFEYLSTVRAVEHPYPQWLAVIKPVEETVHEDDDVPSYIPPMGGVVADPSSYQMLSDGAVEPPARGAENGVRMDQDVELSGGPHPHGQLQQDEPVD